MSIISRSANHRSSPYSSIHMTGSRESFTLERMSIRGFFLRKTLYWKQLKHFWEITTALSEGLWSKYICSPRATDCTANFEQIIPEFASDIPAPSPWWARSRNTSRGLHRCCNTNLRSEKKTSRQGGSVCFNQGIILLLPSMQSCRCGSLRWKYGSEKTKGAPR